MKFRAILLGLIIGSTFFVAACEKLTISRLTNDPARYADKEIGIIGTVKKVYGVNIPFTPVRGGVYEVDDGTGSIWVATQRGVPSQGARVGVKGRFQNAGVNFNGKTYGGLGLIENDRRVK
jgi:hypothetical protein